MAREPSMSGELYKKILSNLKDIGYDISLIQSIEQNWD
jgi:hypothetical protein